MKTQINIIQPPTPTRLIPDFQKYLPQQKTLKPSIPTPVVPFKLEGIDELIQQAIDAAAPAFSPPVEPPKKLYVSTEDMEHAKEFTREKLKALSEQPSFLALPLQRQGNALFIMAQLCLSYDTKTNFMTPYKTLPDEVLTVMGGAINDICAGTYEIKFGSVDFTEYNGSLNDSCHVGTQTKLDEKTFFAANIHDPAGKIPDRIYFSTVNLTKKNVNPNSTYLPEITTHEFAHNLFHKSNLGYFDCVKNLTTEMDAYQIQAMYHYCSNDKAKLAPVVAAVYEDAVKNGLKPIVDQLTGDQIIAYNAMIGQLKKGIWITPAEFETTLRNADSQTPNSQASDHK